MASRNKKRNNAGIYLIRHKPSGMLYVGQANDVIKRWGEHKKQLNAGIHHNKRLQKLWRNSGVDDFEFEIVKKAPHGLSALQLQRWLIKEEREIYTMLKEKGVALNEAEPEIVATDAAIREYEKEVKERNKQNDKIISAKRREIKKKIEDLRKKIEPQRRRLYELERKHSEKSKLIKNSTGWRRLFYGRPPDFDLEEERRNLDLLTSEINRISSQVNSIQKEIHALQNEYRRLYGEFTKVAKRRMRRSALYWLMRPRNKPKISE